MDNFLFLCIIIIFLKTHYANKQGKKTILQIDKYHIIAIKVIYFDLT